MEKVTSGTGASADATLALLGGLGAQTDGVEMAYQALDLVVARYQLSEAYLVLRPTPLSPQIFANGRGTVTAERATDLARRPSGLYTRPDAVPLAVQDALTGSCELALAAHVARNRASVDPLTGLSTRRVIDTAVRRAASRSGRFRWSFSVVLLTTTGPETPTARWQALASVMRATLRLSDEAGIASRGRAVAILANTGAEAVEPFVARLRAALEAAHGDDIHLHAGWVTAPIDSVDPDQLWRICEERLADAVPPSDPEDGTNRVRRTPASEIELELRCVPGVLSVATTGLDALDPRTRHFTVGVDRSDEDLRQSVVALMAGQLGEFTLVALDDIGFPIAPASPVSMVVTGTTATRAIEVLSREPDAEEDAESDMTLERRHERTVEGQVEPGDDDPPVPPRVVLLDCAFDPSTGDSEVSLTWRGVQVVGRATGTPLAGAAQATLTAVKALGATIPYYVTSVERATTHPGSPVVVALAESDRGDRPIGARRLGVAAGADEIEAASRATLSALNRLLSKMPSPR